MATVTESTATGGAGSAPALSRRRLPDLGRVPILWIGPALLALLAIVIVPMGYSLYVSTLDWNLSRPQLGQEQVGLRNFRDALANETFRTALVNTFELTAIIVALELVLGLGLALFLRRPGKLSLVLGALVIIPTMITPIVVGLIWRYLLFPGYGIVHSGLTTLGLNPGSLISSKRWAPWSLVVTDVWEWTPFVALVLLGGLLTIPPELDEAARMDGLGAWARFRYVTLPLLRPFIFSVVLFRIMDVFKLFDIVYILTQGGPGNDTLTAVFATYNEGLRFFNMGTAAAYSWIITIVIVAVLTVFLRVSRRLDAGRGR